LTILQYLNYNEINNKNRNSISHYAAVAICILPNDKIVYIKRQDTMPTHKGQIAFPGGKAQAEDKDIVDTAVRETKEELLLPSSYLEPIGILSGFDTREFEFPVYPVVCKLESVNLLDFNNTEVQKVYSVDITYLNDPSNWVYRGWYDSDWIVKIEEDILWGATARMTLELFQLRLD
tara:strand:+ start:1380 stop:1910 length:531 start_codon:yes stop_codon:yes gene_type:complete